MKKGEISIVIPGHLYLLKGNPNPFGPWGSISPQGQIEYNLFYKNFIYPYDDSMDVLCTCEFGQKFNDFWRFNGVCDKESFPLLLEVYSAYGDPLAKKEVIIHVTEAADRDFGLLCIGDSMTRGGVYVHQATQLLPGLKAMGTRCFDGVNYAEGRGGWTAQLYFERADGAGAFSPFLFPSTVPGERYLGNAASWKQIARDCPEGYDFVGSRQVAEFYGLTAFDQEGFPLAAREGDVVNNNGLFRKEGESWVAFEDTYEFHFAKYLERYGAFLESTAGKRCPDAVSVLLGTNDFSFVRYEDTLDKVEEIVSRYRIMVDSIKACCPDIKIIFNLPVETAGVQGHQALLSGSAKRQRYNLLSFSERLLELWDNEESRRLGIYICPMMNFQDMVNGFAREAIKVGSHFEGTMPVFTNAVHPTTNGYKQMGDVLAGVVGELMKG